jgi:hypothetical protein
MLTLPDIRRCWMSPDSVDHTQVHWQREEPSREIVRFAEESYREGVPAA